MEWLRSIVIDNKVTWQGYSMGCDMALDNMDLLCRGSCSTNKRGKMVVDDCVFIPFGNGLGLFNKITVVVHGETYLPDSDCTDLPPKDALNRIVVPELRKKGETFVYINNATIVKAENNGRREYRAFVGTNSAILFYHRGEFLQEFGPGQTQLNVKALNKERDRVEELRKSA
ncbi:TPA: hypothetical protein HA246_02860 [Candidatus Woesearchaeota archaeon]|nr:hypothetical protein [Candidatus Woesearchaeota archaeon]